MLASEILYLEETVRAHIHRFFTNAAMAALEAVPLRWCTMAEIAQSQERAIFIPKDVSIGATPGSAWRVPFGSTHLTFWNKLPPPFARMASAGSFGSTVVRS